MVEKAKAHQKVEQASRGHQMVEALLAKPSQKPNFASFQQPEVLKRAQAFLPAFIQSTDRILSNTEVRQASQMDVQIAAASQFQSDELPLGQESQKADGATTINMEIGVGVFDVENEQQLGLDSKQKKPAAEQASASELPPGMGFHETSTEPILRVLKANKDNTECQKHLDKAAQMQCSDTDSESDDDSSDCEDRFMQFDDSSDSDEKNQLHTPAQDEEAMVDAQSGTTKASVDGQKSKHKATVLIKKPLIEEIASHEFTNPEEESKDGGTTDVQVGQKRKFHDR